MIQVALAPQAELKIGPLEEVKGLRDLTYTAAIIVKVYKQDSPEYGRWRRAYREQILGRLELRVLCYGVGAPRRRLVLAAVDRVRAQASHTHERDGKDIA